MTVRAATGVHYVTGLHRSTHVILIISTNRYFSRRNLIVAHMVKKNSMFMQPYSSSCSKKRFISGEQKKRYFTDF